jgi:hypothetical protein
VCVNEGVRECELQHNGKLSEYMELLVREGVNECMSDECE